jgi:hypothetical protein
MGAKSPDYGDAVAFELPVYRFSAEETVATVGVLEQDGARVEGISLPRQFDPSQGDLSISVDASLAAGMRDGLDYLEHFPYECTEQTVSRFLPNVVTYRALKELKMEDKKRRAVLPMFSTDVFSSVQQFHDPREIRDASNVHEERTALVNVYVHQGRNESEAPIVLDENHRNSENHTAHPNTKHKGRGTRNRECPRALVRHNGLQLRVAAE